MSDARLPPVAASVLIAAVDGLAARLRGKLDATTARVAGWDVTAADGAYAVAVDAATTVRLVPDGGVVRTADAASCSCLLAPNCLHRAAVLAAAPVEEPTTTAPDAALSPDRGADPSPPDPGAVTSPDRGADPSAPDRGAETSPARAVDGERPRPVAPADHESYAPTAAQLAAVGTLWRATVAVIESGVTGTGVVARTSLLRAAHEAQATGVYRAAATARAVASLLQAARERAPHYRLADLTDALRDLLGVLHRLGLADPAAELLGQARRPYDVQGSLRLYGLCTTAVLAGSGYAGVVTYVLDADGTAWTIADLAPGDAHRAANAGNATVALGESALQHRQLTRAGLVVSGATASATRQLGAGKSVRAVTATGATWHEQPAARRWAEPLPAQLHRAFTSLAQPITDRRAGEDLVFLSVRIEGAHGGAVHTVTEDGTTVQLLVASDHPALAYRDNLRLLSRSPGLELLVIGRPVRARQASVEALAVAPPAPGAGWALPATIGGHVDLAYDRLHSSHLPAGVAAIEPAAATLTGDRMDEPEMRSDAADPALELLRRNLERVAAGGRSVLAFPPSPRYPSDSRRLRRARLETGSELLDALTTAAVTRPRDTFGRLLGDNASAFAQAWLAAAVYADAADRAFAEASWLPA